jgi:hypothetical protein
MTEVGFTDLSALGAGGGNKPSTQRGRDAALTHFTNFLSFIKVWPHILPYITSTYFANLTSVI